MKTNLESADRGFRRCDTFTRLSRTTGILVGLLLVVEVAHARHPVIALLPNNLDAARIRLARGDRSLRPAREKLVADADRLLRKSPPTVLDKTVIAPSGDKHDYFSVSPCWWPDPEQPKGRPYIWRDGVANPGNRAGRVDATSFARMGEGVETLALAYFFTERERYAKKAAQFLRVWFVDPATRMNPHLRHAATVPGTSYVRGNGIFEFRDIIRVLDSVALLHRSYAWTAQDDDAFRAWLRDYYLWLTTSEQGIAERAMPNHHGSWHDVQVVRIAMALNRRAEALEILRTALTVRVGLQIQPDGAQPLELARANAVACSISNLEALFQLGLIAENLRMDWWKHVSPEGGSLQGALAYLNRAIDAQEREASDHDRQRFATLLAQTRQRIDLAPGEDGSEGRRLQFGKNDGRGRLLWP